MTEAPEKPGGSQPSSKSEGAEQPVAQPPEQAVTKSEKAIVKEARTRSQRSLFILVMLMFFVSIVVFVVGTYFFMVPRVITQDLEIRHLQTKLNAFEDAILAGDPATEEAGAPEEAAPAAPDAPEVKPAKAKPAPEKKAPEK